MARRQSTLPDRKKKDSENELLIMGIEEKSNTVIMNINGCRVIAVFRERNNAEVYSRIKGILINSVIQKSCAKI